MKTTHTKARAAWNHYYRQGISLINLYEDATSQLFGDNHGSVEKSFFESLDAKDMPKIMAAFNTIARIVSDCEKGQG